MHRAIRHRWPSLLGAMALLSSMLAAPPALGWGSEGHRISGLVAEQLLTPEARQAIVALAGKLDLAAEATVLDRRKEALNERIPGSRHWHYDDRPACDATAPKSSYCADGNCASFQIGRWQHVLADKDAKPAARYFALQVLVHLVGDIHQPLHTADNDDAGGNGVKLRLSAGTALVSTNLHSAWDTYFVRAAMPGNDERQTAAYLLLRFAADIPGWQQGYTTRWMREGYERARRLAYGPLAVGAAVCPLEVPDQVNLPAGYVDEAVLLVPELLAQAGARIAAVLNRAFAP